jgi:hypothetical protein
MLEIKAIMFKSDLFYFYFSSVPGTNVAQTWYKLGTNVAQNAAQNVVQNTHTIEKNATKK